MPIVKNLIKWLSYLVIGLVILLGAGVVVVNFYKDEILAKINAKLNGTVEGDVRIGDYHVTFLHAFPHFSITLSDIYLHGPKYDQYHTPFLKAEDVHINIVPYKLLAKQLVISSVDIENGEIFIFKTRTGYTNTEMLKSRKAHNSGNQKELAVVDLHEINLRHMKFTFHDSLKLKHLGIDFVHTRNKIGSDSGRTVIESSGRLTFHGLMMNAEKGSFLREVNASSQLNLSLDSSLTEFIVKPSRLAFEKTTVNLYGVFHLGDQKHFELSIKSENADHREALQIVHDTLASKLSKFSVDGPIKVSVQVRGVMQAGIKPAVDASFSLHDSYVTSGSISAAQLSLNGSFMNHVNTDVPNDENNARMTFENVKGKIDNIPIEATVVLTDMKDPHLDLKAVFDTPLKNLNQNFDSTSISFRSGHFRSSFTYSGKLREYMDKTRTEYSGKLSGQATISDGALYYNKRSYNVKNVNAVFDFTEKVFAISSLTLSVNNNDVAVTGSVKDVIPFFLQPEGNAKIKLSITSPKIDLTGITKPRIAVSKTRAKAKIRKSKEKMVDIVDHLNEHLDLDVSFNIAQFVNRNFKGSQLKGQLLLKNNQFTLNNLAMNFGGGKVQLNTRITDVADKISPISIQTKVTDIALKDFFLAFNDFGQKTFTHEKVEGKLSMTLDLNSAIDDKLDLQMSRLDGDVAFSIREMRLMKFEPIQNLSNFLMKGRDFSDVSFSDINSRVVMNGTKMAVARMEIESTVIGMFIEGIYDLGDSTDLAVQVPLSNLKKRDQDIPPENIGTDSRVGPSVYLRVRTDRDGKTTISYDPFKKFRKNSKGKKNNAA